MKFMMEKFSENAVLRGTEMIVRGLLLPTEHSESKLMMHSS